MTQGNAPITAVNTAETTTDVRGGETMRETTDAAIDETTTRVTTGEETGEEGMAAMPMPHATCERASRKRN